MFFDLVFWSAFPFMIVGIIHIVCSIATNDLKTVAGWICAVVWAVNFILLYNKYK